MKTGWTNRAAGTSTGASQYLTITQAEFNLLEKRLQYAEKELASAVKRGASEALIEKLTRDVTLDKKLIAICRTKVLG